MIYETERFILRRFQASDLEAICLMESDEEVMKMTGPGRAQTTAESQARLERILAHSSRVSCGGYWAATLKTNGELVGWFMLLSMDIEQTQFELGFMIRKDCWGQGYAGEIARHLVEMAKLDSNINELVAKTSKDNQASQKLLISCGFTLKRSAELVEFNKFV
tara:strand:+ start:8696 stop:9184 length:489 start_codon:yes stop_codon:yes gene_type:complete